VSYQINLYNGTPKTTISDGSIDQTTSLTLVGRNYAGYGVFLNENFVYLLENFSSTGGPNNPLVGQLWWDSANKVLKVWSGTSWKISSGATTTTNGAPPIDTSVLGGDLWWDDSKGQLNAYSPTTGWTVIGPVSAGALSNTGVFPAIVSGKPVLTVQIGGITQAIISGNTFASGLTGFSTIKAGLNFNSTSVPTQGLNTQDVNATAGTLVQRDGSGSINVNVLNATSATAQTFTGNLVGTVTGNVTATTVGATNITATTISATNIGTSAASNLVGTLQTAAQPYVTSLGTLANLSVTGTTTLTGTATLNGSPIATLGSGGTFSSIQNTPIGNTTPNTGAFTTLSSTGDTSVGGNATVTGGLSVTGNTALSGSATLNGVAIATVGGATTFSSINNTPIGNTTPSTGGFTTLTVTGNITPTSNLSANIGSATNWFNNIYGTAIHARYADLAERFAADAEYTPGTVVEMGGSAEITKVTAELSDKVFGVISTNAAYLMNSTAGNNLTHPPVAMSGRVPVRAVGLISKGDRLVSAGNGVARAGKTSELTPWNVIGRSLVDKSTEEESLIEAIVKINS
jgi:hypothetical protein